MCFFDQICKRYKLLVLQGLFSLLITPLYAQQSVGIGTNTPNPKAVLQLVSPGQNQGFLLPKLTTGQITSLGLTLVAADKGLQVYDSLLQQIRYWDGSSWLTLSTSAASGTVTSVGLSLPAIFSISGSPVTTSGVLSATFLNQAQNTVFAGPTTGSASPTFRTLVAGDIPSLPATIITSGTLPIARGGTNGTAAPTSGAVAYGTGTAYAFTAAGTSGQLLRSNGAAAPSWVNAPAAGWSLTGNAGTNPLTNFLGSTDPVDVTIRRGSGQSLRLEQFNISQFSNGIDESAIFNVANSDFSHKITLFSGRQNDPNPFKTLWGFMNMHDLAQLATSESGLLILLRN
jgi:hypothetical protein